MKIAMISRIFDPARGGLERFHVNLARMLVEMGEDVTVFAEKWMESSVFSINRVGVKKTANLFAPNNVRFADAVRRRIHHRDFDVTIANTPYYPCDIHRAGFGVYKSWYRMRAQARGGLFKLAGLQPRYRFALNLEKKVYDPDRVRLQIANSYMIKTQMVQEYGFPGDRISVIYNGIDFDLFNMSWCEKNKKHFREQMNFSDMDFVILFPSNDFWRKGGDILVQALQRADTGGNAVLLAVGEDRFKPGNVRARFVGHQKNILPYYAVCDCLILPTLYDACSNVVLEAMACGKVAVTTPTNGASEFITHDKSGFVLTSWNDVIQLKTIIEQLHGDRQRIMEIGQNAFESVKGHTLEKNARHVMELCYKCADHN
jgi:UDP-glucose:(heptosyl)LPS alpha-1,3-glucosyltransferase